MTTRVQVSRGWVVLTAIVLATTVLPLLRTERREIPAVSAPPAYAAVAEATNACIPGCRDACFATKVDNTQNLPINYLLDLCSTASIPSLGGLSCVNFSTFPEYESCLNTVCPDLLPYARSVNPECVTCMQTACGSSTEQILRTCATTYDSTNAASCHQFPLSLDLASIKVHKGNSSVIDNGRLRLRGSLEDLTGAFVESATTAGVTLSVSDGDTSFNAEHTFSDCRARGFRGDRVVCGRANGTARIVFARDKSGTWSVVAQMKRLPESQTGSFPSDRSNPLDGPITVSLTVDIDASSSSLDACSPLGRTTLTCKPL